MYFIYKRSGTEHEVVFIPMMPVKKNVDYVIPGYLSNKVLTLILDLNILFSLAVEKLNNYFWLPQIQGNLQCRLNVYIRF